MSAPSDRPAPAELEQFAVELAHGAAQIIRSRDRSELAVSTKSTLTDLVTQVDRDTESWLVEQIAAARPRDAVLGEEGGEHAGATSATGATGATGASAVRWLIDPIDGTVNFVLGIPHFAVSVAAEVDGLVVAGAVVNPVSGETFRASHGGGAWLDDRPLTGPRDVPLSRAVIGTGFGYDAALRSRQIRVVRDLLPRISDIRRFGAASLDLCSVAAGRLDGYFEAGLSPWDWAAGGLIAAEAGCPVTGLRGQRPSSRMTATAGTGLASTLFAALEGLNADEVSTS